MSNVHGNILSQLQIQSFAQCGNGSGRPPNNSPYNIVCNAMVERHVHRYEAVYLRQWQVSLWSTMPDPHCSVGVEISPLMKIYILAVISTPMPSDGYHIVSTLFLYLRKKQALL